MKFLKQKEMTPEELSLYSDIQEIIWGNAFRPRNFLLITERGLKMSRQVARKQRLRKALAWAVAVVVVFTFATLAFWLAPASMGPGPEPFNAVYDKGE